MASQIARSTRQGCIEGIIRELKYEVFIYGKMKGKESSKDNFNRESTGK